MREKFLSLILGLIVILASPVFTSCVNKATKNDVKTETSITAEVSNLMYVAPEVAQCRDVAFVAVQDLEGSEPAAPAAPTNNTMMIVAAVMTVLMTLLSVVFKTKADRAIKTINKISEALADRKLTAEEIRGIIEAWKGK